MQMDQFQNYHNLKRKISPQFQVIRQHQSPQNYQSQMTSRILHQHSPNQDYTSYQNSSPYSFKNIAVQNRPSVGKRDLVSTIIQGYHNSDQMYKQNQSILNYENNKQASNNPLKDISNRVVNKDETIQTQEKSLGKAANRYSMPFGFSPKTNLKINNFLDQPFKQLTPSVKNIQGLSSHQLKPTSQISVHESPTPTYSHQDRPHGGLKISNFDEQSSKVTQIGNSINSVKAASNIINRGGYFEKKRLSDNTSLKYQVDEKLKIEEEVIREIYDRKEKQRKGHNVSVTTNTSTTSNTTNTNATTIKKTAINYGQYGQTNSGQITSRKSQASSKLSSISQTPQNIEASNNQHNQAISNFQSQQQSNFSISVNAIQTLIASQEKTMNNIIDQIKRKSKPTFSINETNKSIKELTKTVKAISNDNNIEFLLRQHCRTHFISYAFIKALQEELMGQAKQNENLQQILLNALDYIKKNLKCFSEIIDNQQNKQSHKGSKKDLNSNPFGVMGPPGSRNSSNKENYGGNSNTANKNIGSKSEKKMFIKQNIQIALAFLKKICRLSKTNQDKFKDMLQILNFLESGSQITKVKDQIKKALHQIRNEHKNTLTSSTISFSQTQKCFTKKSHFRRESITIDIDDEPVAPLQTTTKISPFEFAELKEETNEDSTEENEVTKANDKNMRLVTIESFEDSQRKETIQTIKTQRAFTDNQNLVDVQPGRHSLQPQHSSSLVTLTPKVALENIQTIQTISQEQKENIPYQQGTQISIVTKKNAQRISNTHEPITVRGARPIRIQLNDDNLQFIEAPAHINPRSNSLPSREPYLPSDSSKEYTLVLDLDETLVHFDPVSNFQFKYFQKIRTYRPRPGSLKFLSEMSKYYEIVVFTAGLKDYADWILNDFDRNRFIQHRLYRDHTKYRNGVYVKDLSKLGRDMNKIIIIDNIEENFQAQPDNGIPIKGWYHDPNDKELEKMTPFLRRLAANRVHDVKPEVRAYKNGSYIGNGHGSGSPTHRPSYNSNYNHQTISNSNYTHSPQAQTHYSRFQHGTSTYHHQQPNTNHLQGSIRQPWMSDSEESSERDKSSEEEESSEEESPPKKKTVAAVTQKKAKKEESSEEEESDSEEENPKKKQKKKQDSESEEESEEESPPKKKPPAAKTAPPKKVAKKESADDEEDSEEQNDSSEEDEKPAKKSSQPIKSKQTSQLETQKTAGVSQAIVDEYERRVKEMEVMIQALQEDNSSKGEVIEEKVRDVKKLQLKLLQQDEEISQQREHHQNLEHKIKSKDEEINHQNTVIQDKDVLIAQQTQQIASLQGLTITNATLQKQLAKMNEEMGILKAKYNLDMIAMTIKLIPEYPDMVEECWTLERQADEKDSQIKGLEQTNIDLTTMINNLDIELKSRDSTIKSLSKDKETLQKQVKDLLAHKKHSADLLKIQEQQVANHEHLIKQKNDELEQRLENISKLIQKNEQLSQQLRVSKQRLEKYKNEQGASYQKDIQDKASEIEVLKEMVKGNQMQLKAKERELVRYKQKVQQLEGVQLAQRQQQNMMNMNGNQSQVSMFSNNQTPTVMNGNGSRQLGQLKQTPQRYQQQKASASKLPSTVNSSKNSSYFPPLQAADNKSNHSQYSQKSNLTRGGGSKESNQRVTPTQYTNKYVKQADSSLTLHGNHRHIVEEAEGEMEYSSSVDRLLQQQQAMIQNQRSLQSQSFKPPIGSHSVSKILLVEESPNNHNRTSNTVYGLANEVKEVIHDENDELIESQVEQLKSLVDQQYKQNAEHNQTPANGSGYYNEGDTNNGQSYEEQEAELIVAEGEEEEEYE